MFGETFTVTTEVEYSFNGWSIHSGAGRKRDRWWLACYVMGERVATLETKRGLVTYRSPQEATARAVRLNKKGITLNSLGKMV